MLNLESEFISLVRLTTQAQRRRPGEENRDSGTASTNRIGLGHASSSVISGAQASSPESLVSGGSSEPNHYTAHHHAVRHDHFVSVGIAKDGVTEGYILRRGGYQPLG
jgi:hypothetical protein